MAKGESNWTTKGKTAKRFSFTPVPAGDHEGKLDTSTASVAMAAGEGKFPYIKIRIEILNSAEAEGQKNRLVFHNLFCSMKEAKNGDLMPERADQLLGLAKALGEDFEPPYIQMPDENGNDVDVLDPKVVLQWLREQDGKLIKLTTKIDHKDKNYDPKAVVKYFHETEQADAFGAEEEEVEEVEVEEEEEAPPPPKKTAKPAPKKR